MSEGIVTIATFMNPVQADFAKSILEMEGIECWLIDEAMCNVAPAYVFAVGGVKLQVRKSDAPRAVAALQRKESTGKEGHTDRDDTSYPSSRPDDEADSLPERTALMKPGELPEFVKNLPEADQPLEGLRAWLLQGETMQIIFMEAEREVLLPRHAHGDQWGVVVSGRLELTIGEETRICNPGDSYFIPAGIEHHGRLHPGFRAVDCFADKDRYKPRRSE